MRTGGETLNRKVVKLALPMSLEGLLTASSDFADTLMVSSLGEASVSAVGLGTQLFFIQSMTIYGFVGGASTYMAQFYGSGNLSGIRKTLSVAVSTLFLISLALFLLVLSVPESFLRIFTDIDQVARLGADYMICRSPCLLLSSVSLPLVMALKSMQQVRLPVFASITAVLTNVTLNYALIFGKWGLPAMGVEGAALATTVSQAVNVLILFSGMVLCHSPLLQEKRDYISLNPKLILEVFKNAVPTTINEMMWSGGMSAYNAVYGRISILASAAAQAADIVSHIFTKTIYSVGDASLILIGELLGRGAREEARRCAARLLKLNVLLGIAAGGLLIAVAYPVAGLFGFEETSFRYLVILLCIYGIFMPLKVYNITLITGILRAGGDVRFAMVTEVSAIWLVSVPLVFLGGLVLELPVYVAVLFAQAEDLVKCVILTRRFRSGKWANNKVEGMNV